MSGAPNDPARPIRLHRALEAIWSTPPGLARLSAVNHSIVGRRFIVTALAFFAIAGLLAMLLRTQLARPLGDFLGPHAYHQIMTMHGTIMMFLFAIPMIEGMALYLLPKMLGARDLAFPRLSAFGYWCYLFGGSILVATLLFGAAPDGGWFMYTPLTSLPYSPGIGPDAWLLGITFVEVSAIAAAVEIVVTVLKIRAPGMALHRMPLFAWYLLVTAFMILGAFPPLILASILLELERAFRWPFFDPGRGGDPLLWQHLFWLFGHPEVYIIFLPGAAAVSTILPVFARHPIVGYAWIVASIVALGFLSFGLWVHHMFVTGLPELALGLFSAASLLVTVPTAVQIFAWIATLAKGRPVLGLPMLYLLGFFFVFVAGGLTGVMVAVVPFDAQAHGTHFIVAHLHYVLIGGFVFPLLAAAYYWLPQLSGRLPVFHFGKAAFWLLFVGFNLTFLVMHWTGLLGMPRRVFTYEPGLGLGWPNLVSSFGAFLMTAGFVLFFADVFLQWRYGRPFRRNPWNAGTLEWAMATPPTSYNFASLPRVTSRDPLHDDPKLPASLAAGLGYLPGAGAGRMETIAVDAVSGKAEHIAVLPNRDYTPLWTALALALFFGALLAKVYWLAPAGLVLALAFAWRWAASLAPRHDPPPEDAGLGATLPLHFTVRGSAPALGLVYFLLADAVLFASLVFGGVYLALFARSWPSGSAEPQTLAAWALAAALSLALAGAAAFAAQRSNRHGGRLRDPSLAVSAAGGLGGAVAVTALSLVVAPDPTLHARSALVAFLAAYVALHAVLGTGMAVFSLVQARRGFVSARRALSVDVAMGWQLFTAVAGFLALALGYFLIGIR